jgi:serine/threonine protein kinase
MELIAGRTWRAILQEQHCLPFLQLASWFDQLLAALEAAHNQEVLHRDLKPENVLVLHENTAHPLIKVVGFGLAKVKQAPSRSSVTETGLIMGTAGYMSPEQLSGSRTDERADLYAVGVMVVESITGYLPSDRLHHTTGTFFDGFNQAPALNDLVARCLTTRSEDRIRTADELRRQLIPLLRNRYGDCSITVSEAADCSGTSL